MRSHPYTPAPPLPPLLDDLADELSSILPNQTPRRRGSDTDLSIELSPIDPDTSRLLPVRRKRHHVRIQGKLVMVRSVSTANLRPSQSTTRLPLPPLPGSGSPTGDRPMSMAGGGRVLESAVGTVVTPRRTGRRSRRRSLDDGAVEEGSETETEEEAREVIIRDRQLRGYGIGGAGNIRRATDVANFATRRPGQSMFFSVLPSSAPTTPTSADAPDRKRWNIREMLGLSDKRGRNKAPTAL
ncbi:hypothetical protein QBC47DRAFT_462481 [Echria macrotheca]|uniref:Uncharacterized protein n=1 Tax=Echria macrotheca TaxID=438768 RepID=A0AAJ0FA20_9PEZI|nr:hypothetical protein QBC47DRAFT_462481 [Echria macrotheca]